MNRLSQIVLILILFMSSAMQCNQEVVHLAQKISFTITPNPIPVKNGSFNFASEIELPADKNVKKIDSLVFEYTTLVNGKDGLVGTSTLIIPQNWRYQVSLVHSEQFYIENLPLSEKSQLMVRMTIFSNSRSKSAEEIPVAIFQP